MNVKTVLAHGVVAGLATTVWEVTVHMPAGDPGSLLTAAGAAPFVVAAISLAIAHDAQRQSQPVRRPQVPRQGRPQPARKELAR